MQFEQPKPSGNDLKDIIDWITLGDCVIIYCGNRSRTFHKDGNISHDKRVIYIDVAKLPGLLDDGEWNWYIEDAGHRECDFDPDYVPTKEQTFCFALGM